MTVESKLSQIDISTAEDRLKNKEGLLSKIGKKVKRFFRRIRHPSQIPDQRVQELIIAPSVSPATDEYQDAQIVKSPSVLSPELERGVRNVLAEQESAEQKRAEEINKVKDSVLDSVDKLPTENLLDVLGYTVGGLKLHVGRLVKTRPKIKEEIDYLVECLDTEVSKDAAFEALRDFLGSDEFQLSDEMFDRNPKLYEKLVSIQALIKRSLREKQHRSGGMVEKDDSRQERVSGKGRRYVRVGKIWQEVMGEEFKSEFKPWKFDFLEVGDSKLPNCDLRERDAARIKITGQELEWLRDESVEVSLDRFRLQGFKNKDQEYVYIGMCLPQDLNNPLLRLFSETLKETPKSDLVIGSDQDIEDSRDLNQLEKIFFIDVLRILGGGGKPMANPAIDEGMEMLNGTNGRGGRRIYYIEAGSIVGDREKIGTRDNARVLLIVGACQKRSGQKEMFDYIIKK